MSSLTVTDGVLYGDMDATYSPEDNKLRLYAATRLDPELYQRVRGAGFIWAPKQELFVAPRWTPQAEDLALELAGEIGDEDTSLADRAEARAERFGDYSDKRGREADQAREAVAAIADNIPLGQPILIGHHSEKHARRDAEKIDRGMRKAVNLWRTSKYWTARAAGVMHHADYKARPDVRRRRIKTLEADRRKHSRQIEKDRTASGHWTNPNFPLTQKRAANIANHYGPFGMWSDLDGGKLTAEEARANELPRLADNIEHQTRWVDHLTLRIGYERALLGDDTPPDKDTPKAAPRRSAAGKLPLLNYPGEGFHHMTKAEYAKIGRDYKGTRMIDAQGQTVDRWNGRNVADATHRVRSAIVGGGHGGRGLCSVYLTDQKTTEPERIERRKGPVPGTEQLDAPPYGHHWRLDPYDNKEAGHDHDEVISIPNMRAGDVKERRKGQASSAEPLPAGHHWESPNHYSPHVARPNRRAGEEAPPTANAAGEMELAL